MALDWGGLGEGTCGGFLFVFRLPITRGVFVLEALEAGKGSREGQEQNKTVLLCLSCSAA